MNTVEDKKAAFERLLIIMDELREQCPWDRKQTMQSLRNLTQLKMKEGKKSVLSGVPQSLPAMVKAYRMQDKTAQVGFEWDTTDQVWEKVEEEIGELKEAVAAADQDHIEEEFGDVLFSMINYARFIGVDPETALEKINKKFKSRFEYIEQHSPRPLTDMSLQEMDDLWNEAKKLQKSNA